MACSRVSAAGAAPATVAPGAGTLPGVAVPGAVEPGTLAPGAGAGTVCVGTAGVGGGGGRSFSNRYWNPIRIPTETTIASRRLRCSIAVGEGLPVQRLWSEGTGS